ncbi:MAG: hypothetical protein ABIP33_06525 [Pseudolysinimonas sp.]
MLRTLATPFVWLFSKIAEPKVARIIQFVIYVCLFICGLYVLMHPPVSFLFVLGEGLVAVFGSFLVAGGILAAIAVLPGRWALERIGIISLWTGLGLFAIIAAALGISIVGFVIALCLSLSLLLRWLDIRKYQRAPGA